jgi:hypothetical protein
MHHSRNLDKVLEKEKLDFSVSNFGHTYFLEEEAAQNYLVQEVNVSFYLCSFVTSGQISQDAIICFLQPKLPGDYVWK